MDVYDGRDGLVEGSSAEIMVAGLRELYSEISTDQADLARFSGMSCPAGCGSCCIGFMPDLLRPEAMFIASFLRSAGSGSAGPQPIERIGLEYPDGTCPFHDFDQAFHCSIYPARPLVCRLFGYTSQRAKSGTPAFTPCKHMPKNKRGLYEGGRSPRLPPAMDIYSSRLLALDPGSASEREPIAEAVRKALERMSLMERLASGL